MPPALAAGRGRLEKDERVAKVTRLPARTSLLLLAAAAAVGLAPPPIDPRAPVRGPEAAAVRLVIGPYLQAVGRTQATVRWETDGAIAGRLSWGRTPDCPHTVTELSEGTRHEVRLAGLLPATRYWYRVDGAGAPPSPVSFATEGDRASPLRMVVYGDTRTGHDAHALVVAGASARAPMLAIHVGDFVDAPTEESWRTFFAIEAPLISRLPLLPVLGNHEGDGRRYLQLFALPDEGGGGGRFHSERWGLVAVLALDSQQSVRPGSPQYRWAEARLAGLAADPDITFIFCVLHHGPYCAASGHGSNLEVRAHLVPLFERYGVDIVFSGHDHVYERSTVSGVKYVVTGGGGAPLHAAGHAWWTEVAASVFEYCVLDIEGATLAFTAVEAGTDRVIDAFRLAKRQRECADDQGCSDITPRGCPPGEAGRFRCLAGTCVWNCTQDTVSPRARRRLPCAPR